MVLSLIAAVVVVPTYTAQASLLVLLSPEYAYHAEAGSDEIINGALQQDSILNSEVQILTSPAIEEASIRQIGLDKLYPGAGTGIKQRLENLAAAAARLVGFPMPATDPGIDPVKRAVGRFGKKLSATADKTASVIQVSFAHKNPDVAAAVVNAVIANYLSQRQKIYLDLQSNVVAQQAEGLRQKLDQASQAITEFQAANGISDFDAQMAILLRRQDDLTQDLFNTDSTIAEAGSRLTAIDQQLKSTPSDIVLGSQNEADLRTSTLRSNLANMRQQEATLEQNYVETAQPVVEIKREIEQLQAELDRANQDQNPSSVQRGRNSVYDALALDRAHTTETVDGAQGRRTQLAAQLDATKTAIADLQKKRQTLEELRRQKDILEQNYATTTKTLSDRQMIESIDAKKAANVRVIQPAEIPINPAPIRMLLLVAAPFLSIFLGFMTALLSDVFRKGYLSSETIERNLGLPVIASISDGERAKGMLTLLLRPET
jgi:uncharacterized protein involved in exopolysaccharide biosynthesis